MRQPAALYEIRQLLQEQQPHLPDRLQAVLALWVEGSLLGLKRMSGYGHPYAELE